MSLWTNSIDTNLSVVEYTLIEQSLNCQFYYIIPTEQPCAVANKRAPESFFIILRIM